MKFSLTHLTLVVIFSASIQLTHGYVGHHEKCDQSASATACDPYADLACRNATCECITSQMEYDSSKRYCRVLAEGSCYKSSGSTFRCVEGSYCSYESEETKRKCLCNYQHSPAANGHCMKSFGATCEEPSECNTLDHLICDFGACRCPQPMNHVFKEKRNRCFIKVGGPCTRNPGPNDVTCDPEENECMADLLSKTGYSCQCLAGNHMEHFERQCVKGNLQTCEDLAGELLHPPCDIVAGLGCHDKKCQCTLSPDLEWDEKKTACAVMEGRGCSLQHNDAAMWWIGFGEYYFQCFTGLECVQWEGHEYEGICRKTKKDIVEA